MTRQRRRFLPLSLVMVLSREYESLPSPPPVRRRSFGRSLAAVIGWTLLAVVVATLIVRWRPVEVAWQIGLAGLTPFLVVPLVVAAVGAGVSRSRSLIVTVVLVTGGFLYTVAPVDAVVGCRPATDNGIQPTDAVTVYTANIQGWNTDPSRFAAAVDAAGADVVVMQEVRPEFLDRLAEEPALERFAQRSSALQRDVTHLAIWSRFPLDDLRAGTIDSKSTLHATVDGPGGPFTMSVVHATSPFLDRFAARWLRQYDQLLAYDTTTPHVMAGDFNATEDHLPFRRLLDAGWTDANDDRGCGPDATWPASGAPVPIMRLDHVLVTDHFEVLSVSTGDPAGSDHRPVIATIRPTD